MSHRWKAHIFFSESYKIPIIIQTNLDLARQENFALDFYVKPAIGEDIYSKHEWGEDKVCLRLKIIAIAYRDQLMYIELHLGSPWESLKQFYNLHYHKLTGQRFI
jgi:hypothetical protein